MDVSLLFNNYQEDFEQARALFAAVFFGTVLLLMTIGAGTLYSYETRKAQRESREANSGGAAWAGAVLGSIVGGVLAVVILAFLPQNSPAEVSRNGANALTIAVNEHYDTQIPRDFIVKAMEAEDNGVITIGLVHEGVEKTFGVRIDKETQRATVYDGQHEMKTPGSR